MHKPALLWLTLTALITIQPAQAEYAVHKPRLGGTNVHVEGDSAKIRALIGSPTVGMVSGGPWLLIQGFWYPQDPASAPEAPFDLYPLRLHQNAPNPFHPSTGIRFAVPGATGSEAVAKLAIYDVQGRRIRSLVNGPLPAGFHQVEWDGRNDLGHRVQSGVYYCRLSSGNLHQTKQLVILK